MKSNPAFSLLTLGALVAALAGADPALACSRVFSTRSANGQAMVVGRTMDLYFNDKPALALRPRGLEESGMLETPTPGALRWKARYGSVGIFSAGKTISDGMNEAGLNANLLYLTGTEHDRTTNNRPKLSNTKMTQYVLDNFATVKEAVEALKQVHVVSERALNRDWPLHLSIADRSGDSAVIEFLKGRMVIHQGASTMVMTNEPPLDWQLTNIKRYKPFGGSLAMPGDPDPASRFVRAATYLKTLPKAASVAEAEADVYAVMKNVAVVRGSQDYSGGNSEDVWTTLWTTVANLDTGTFYVQLARNPYAVWVDLNKVNFGRGGAMRLLDIQPDRLNGDVTELLNRS